MKKIFYFLRISLQLGDTFFSKCVLILYSIVAPLYSRFHILLPLPRFFRIRVGSQSAPVCIGSLGDFDIFKEIFFYKAYEAAIVDSPKVLLDIGANAGYSVIYFKLHFPDVVIYAFEPDLRAFSVLGVNTENFNDVHIYNYAIGSQNGEGILYVSKKTKGSSLYQRSRGQQLQKVEIRSLDSVFDDHALASVDVLKIDVEGSESDIICNSNSLQKIKHIIGEFHEKISALSFDEFSLYLEKSGKKISVLHNSPSKKVFIASQI